jgi:hypothetical protein
MAKAVKTVGRQGSCAARVSLALNPLLRCAPTSRMTIKARTGSLGFKALAAQMQFKAEYETAVDPPCQNL